ncbi:hypothetical protein RAS1_30460 [Phycisphaerae bacterium RAS1]|nr:hypothetical protein RAS1_30460 [Phycisphaerae bacterium RAS1]
MRRTSADRRVRFFLSSTLGIIFSALLLAGCPEAASVTDSINNAIDRIASDNTNDGAATGDSSSDTGGDTRTTTSEGGGTSDDALDGSGDGALPGGGTTDGSGDNGSGTDGDGGTPGVSDDGVFALLGAAAATDEADEFDAPADSPPYFGENSALYTDASGARIDVSTGSIAGDVGERRGDLPDPQVTGGVRGRWIPERDGDDPDRVGGVIRGLWFNHENDAVGALRGVYIPIDPDNLPEGIVGGGLIRAKIVDLNGRFRGILRGRYGHSADGRHLFAGRWFDRFQRLVGVVRGHWRDVEDKPGGVFAGRWAGFSICGEAGSMPDVRFEPNDFGNIAATDEPALPSDDEIDPDEVGFDDDPAVDGATVEDCIDLDGRFGFLRGWHLPRPIDSDGDGEPDRRGGVFAAHWRTAGGDVEGVLMGHYVAREDDAAGDGDQPPGPRVRGRFYGRVLNSDGELIGYVRGVYGRGRFGLGVFRGQYFDAEKEPQGVLRGRWDDAPNRPGGPLLGVWRGVELPLPGDDGAP